MGHLTDAQRLFWETNGYLLIEDALTLEEVARFRRAADAAEERWRNHPEMIGSRIPEFEEIEGILEYDPLFLDLIDHPRVFPLIWEVIGPDVQLLDHAYYITPPGGLVKGHAWHTDLGKRIFGVYQPRSTLMVRAIFALEDIPAHGGATLLLPGSHRFTADVRIPAVQWPEEMPGAVRLTCKAGAAYFYNGNLLHSPGNNKSVSTRRVFLFNYGHRWMRMWKGHEPSEWLKSQADTPMRRQLLGMWRAYYGKDADLEVREQVEVSVG
jgi:ectoine hydroxylase